MGSNEKGATGGKSEAGWDLKANKQASAAPASPSVTSDPGGAPAAATAAPAESVAPAASPTLTRAQRERLNARQPAPLQPAPAPAK